MEITEIFLLLYALTNGDTLLGKIIIAVYAAGTAAVLILVILEFILAVKDYFDSR